MQKKLFSPVLLLRNTFTQLLLFEQFLLILLLAFREFVIFWSRRVLRSHELSIDPHISFFSLVGRKSFVCHHLLLKLTFDLLSPTPSNFNAF